MIQTTFDKKISELLEQSGLYIPKTDVKEPMFEYKFNIVINTLYPVTMMFCLNGDKPMTITVTDRDNSECYNKIIKIFKTFAATVNRSKAYYKRTSK